MNPPWPDVPRLCFGPGEPAHLNACVGSIRSQPFEMESYASGYRDAAMAVFGRATAGMADGLVFPLAFLWRHHLELLLKDVIATGRVLAGLPWEFPVHHRLVNLWEEAKPYVEQCGDPEAIELVNVETNLREFVAIDPGSDGFRYPLNQKGTAASLTNAPELVNLAGLQAAMEAVSNFLSGVQGVLKDRVAYLREEESEAGRR